MTPGIAKARTTHYVKSIGPRAEFTSELFGPILKTRAAARFTVRKSIDLHERPMRMQIPV